jgi:RNA-directed DNA polymerase
VTIVSAHNYVIKSLKKGFDVDATKELLSLASAIEAKGHPYIHSLHHLSYITTIDYVFLRDIVDRRSSAYNHYQIAKRSGGCRYISAPSEDLKLVQRWINKNILSQSTPHWRCFSYHKDASILKCAAQHCGAKWIIKIDIENFFSSINETKVYKLFRQMGYKPLLSFELARLCTFEPSYVKHDFRSQWVMFNSDSTDFPYKKNHVKFFGQLPQGAPSSPQLSNLVFYEADELLYAYALSQGSIYTRYSDDLCFSFCDADFCREKAEEFAKKINRILRVNGFEPKHAKLKIIPPGAKKVVLGLNVDHEKPMLTKAFRKRLESHLHGIGKFGLKAHSVHKKFRTVFGMINHVSGLVSYSESVDPNYGAKVKLEYQAILQRLGIL